jgi:AmmeMemoRadiSam system protein B
MLARQPVAPNFYAGDIKSQMEEYIKAFKPPAGLPARIVAGIVPHAGWFFSGATAAKVFLSIKSKEVPETFVLFGAVHVPGVRANSVYPGGAWQTPVGEVMVDSALAAGLLKELGPELLQDNGRAHAYEHSLEVQTPMIKYLFPEAKIVPIAVPPGRDAATLGEKVGSFIKVHKKDAVVIASTDLTHYGDNYGFAPAGYGRKAHEWMVGNDMRIIELALALKAEGIVAEASENTNACGPGAMAAAVAAAKAMGAAKGHLVEHTTSYDVYPQGDFDMAVGYAGIVF